MFWSQFGDVGSSFCLTKVISEWRAALVCDLWDLANFEVARLSIEVSSFHIALTFDNDLVINDTKQSPEVVSTYIQLEP